MPAAPSIAVAGARRGNESRPSPAPAKTKNGPALQAKYRGTSTGTNRESRNKPSGSTIAAQPRTANTVVSRRSRQAPSAAKVTLTTASPGTLDGNSPKVMKLEMRSRYTGATIAQIVLDVSAGAQPAPSRTAPLPATIDARFCAIGG